MSEAIEVYEAHKLYLSGKTMKDIAAVMGFRSNSTILYHFRKHGLSTRLRGGAIKASQKGPENGNWRGGRSISKTKIRIWDPTHSNSDKRGYVYEHILVATKALGRPLRPGEVVHHIDCNPLNNDANNLLICCQSYHARLHSRMKRRTK